MNVSQAVGPDLFTANSIIAFNPTVTAVGLDIFGNSDVEVRIYNSLNRLIQSTVVNADPSGTFFGAASSQPIAKVELVEVVRSGELIDNLAFGTASVTTSPDADSFAISLSAGESVQVASLNPLDGAQGSNSEPFNTLSARLTVKGPGVDVSNDDSAIDGRTAAIEFTAPIAGVYVIRVEALSGEGEYVVRVAPQALKGFINADGFIVLEANELDAQGLNFFSAGGFLVPIPNGNADPFDFALSNTTNQITLGNLGSTVRLDGRFVTNVRYTGDPSESDLTASYGANSVEVPFSVDELPAIADPLDCNLDGLVDATDLPCVCPADRVDELLATLGLAAGDFNADGRVAFADFLILSRNFGQTNTDYTFGDTNCSGQVDFTDFLILSRNFGA